MKSAGLFGRAARCLAAAAVVTVAVAACTSRKQHNAAERLEEAARKRAGVVSAEADVWTTDISTDNASLAIRVNETVSEDELAGLLGDLEALVEQSGVAGVRRIYVLVGGDAPIAFDSAHAPTDATSPHVTVWAATNPGPDGLTLEVDPATAADRLFQLRDRFGAVASVAMLGTGAAELTFTGTSDGSDEQIGAALDAIISGPDFKTWDDGWSLHQDGPSGQSWIVSSEGDLPATIADAWHRTMASIDLAPPQVGRHRLAFERSFATWKVFSTIRLTPVVPPAELTPQAWGAALRPMIEAQLGATAALGDHQFSLINFYGTTADEFAFDTFLSTAPGGKFVDRGWNDTFLPGN